MLGDFLTRTLLLLLGYAYPAFECYKIVEKNRVDIEELRFWCQYWILVAILTFVERIGDIFISWFPFYGEAKLVFFIYLWYPKSRGTTYVYGTFLRPFLSRHETEIDRKIQEMRARSWDYVVFYGQNFAHIGQAKFFEILQFLAGQSSKFSNNSNPGEKQPQNGPAPRANSYASPTPQQPSSGIDRAMSDPPKTQHVQVHTRSQSEYAYTENDHIPQPGSPNDHLNQARQRLKQQPKPAY